MKILRSHPLLDHATGKSGTSKSEQRLERAHFAGNSIDPHQWASGAPVCTATLRRFRLPQAPLARLLLINLATGAAVGLLWVSGLPCSNPGGLRQLIFADRSPGLAVALLLMSFVITFGSTAMGTAIMTLGQRGRDDKPPRGQGRLALQWLRRNSQS